MRRYLLLLVVLLSHALYSTEYDVSDLVRAAGVSPEHSALAVICLEDGTQWTSGGSRLRKMYSPGCTSRMPQTLIALEERYATPDTPFVWDGQERFLEVWNQDHTLASAFKHSVVWVYQQMTRDLGSKTMAQWLAKFNYGTRKSGRLAINVDGQLHFLRQLVLEELPLAPDTYRLGKKIMCEEATEKWALYAKTGYSGKVGWYVGWIERVEGDHKKRYLFAFNMDVASWDELPKRQAVVRSVLNTIGATP